MFYHDVVAVLEPSRHTFWPVPFLNKSYDFKL